MFGLDGGDAFPYCDITPLCDLGFLSLGFRKWRSDRRQAAKDPCWWLANNPHETPQPKDDGKSRHLP